MNGVPRPRRRAARACWGGLALSIAPGCGGELILLGESVPVPAFADSGRPVAELNGAAAEQHPTLTEDLLEIYYTSDRTAPGSGDVWRATRAARTDPFGPPTRVAEASSDAAEASAAISRDGLTLWVASDRPGGIGELDIWQTHRPSRDADWGPMQNVAELNSASDDLPRPPARAGRVMPLVSDRDADGMYRIHLAERASPDAAFAEVTPLAEIEAGPSPGFDPFLTEDGRLLFFSREAEAGAELYLTWRRSTEEPFGGVLPLDAVNSAANERAPWVSADEIRFFFATDRRPERGFDIYATNLELPRFH